MAADDDRLRTVDDHLTIVLDVPTETALGRVGAGRDRIEDRPAAYRESVRDGYLRVAGGSPFYPAPVSRLGYSLNVSSAYPDRRREA